MKKSILAVVIGCVLCSMATGCGSSVNAEPGDTVITQAETTNAAVVPFETAVSKETTEATVADVFESEGLDLTDVKTVSILDVAQDDEDAENEFSIQVYSGAEKKTNEFTFSYKYTFNGGQYEVEVGETLKKNVSQVNCEWMSAYPEVSKYLDGSKHASEYTTIDCSIYDHYELVYVHIEDPEYSKNETMLEDRYYIKDNTTGELDMIVVSVVRDTAVYGEGTMPITRDYMNTIKSEIYAEFSR